MVWLELQSDAEVADILHLAVVPVHILFKVIERWMEVMGSPPSDTWIRLRGVPLHVRREEIFSLLGECLGSLKKVDPVTSGKDNLLFGRVKVARDPSHKLHWRLYLWLQDRCIPIDVEMEMKVEVDRDMQAVGSSEYMGELKVPII